MKAQFYILPPVAPYPFSKLGYKWIDKNGKHRAIEAAIVDVSDPGMASQFLKMFARGLDDNIFSRRNTQTDTKGV